MRLYVLDSAWADGSNVGTATGAACTAAGEAACPGYQVDHDEHWTPSSPEYKWLAADLASHPGMVKMAVWHYPLRSDESTQDSDVYLQNSAADPAQSSSLESLLAGNGVKVVFNGHAHNYERIAPSGAGQITNYVTGGGGGVLEPVSTGSSCSAFKSSGSIYAIGWSPTSNTGTVCGSGVPTPQSAAQVFNFLKVTVNGGTVTVTPTNAAGQTFDVQSYTYSLATSTVIDTPPPALTNNTSRHHRLPLDRWPVHLHLQPRRRHGDRLHQPRHLHRTGAGGPHRHRDRQPAPARPPPTGRSTPPSRACPPS